VKTYYCFASRQQETRNNKNAYRDVKYCEDFPDYQFVIAGAPSQNSPFMKIS
jgi:hypothetical protein